MSASERSKGKNGELEVVRLLHDHGWPDAQRTSRGTSQEGHGDIAGGPLGVHWEVRRRETINIWACLHQAASDAKPDETPVVAFRRNRSEWMAALPLTVLLDLLLGYEE